MLVRGFGDSSLSVRAKIDKRKKRISTVMKTMISTIKFNQALFFYKMLYFLYDFLRSERCSAKVLFSLAE